MGKWHNSRLQTSLKDVNTDTEGAPGRITQESPHPHGECWWLVNLFLYPLFCPFISSSIFILGDAGGLGRPPLTQRLEQPLHFLDAFPAVTVPPERWVAEVIQGDSQDFLHST